MAMPLKELVCYKGDMYDLVAVVIKRAQQITDIRDAFHPTTLEDRTVIKMDSSHDQFGDEKASVIAFREVFSDKIAYQFDDSV